MGEAKCSAGDSLLCLILSLKTAAVLARFTPAFMIFFVLSLGMVANAAPFVQLSRYVLSNFISHPLSHDTNIHRNHN